MKYIVSTEDDNGYHERELSRAERDALLAAKVMRPCQSGECERGQYHPYGIEWATIERLIRSRT